MPDDQLPPRRIRKRAGSTLRGLPAAARKRGSRVRQTGVRQAKKDGTGGRYKKEPLRKWAARFGILSFAEWAKITESTACGPSHDGEPAPCGHSS